MLWSIVSNAALRLSNTNEKIQPWLWWWSGTYYKHFTTLSATVPLKPNRLKLCIYTRELISLYIFLDLCFYVVYPIYDLSSHGWNKLTWCIVARQFQK